MFFDDVCEIEAVARRRGCTVFGVPAGIEVVVKGAQVLQPVEKSVITIDQVRDLIQHLLVKQQSDQYVVVRPAEKLGEEAANALLKSLEEPKDKTHFILITEAPRQLLATILSRAAVYYLRQPLCLDAPVMADEKAKVMARRLVTAKPAELVALADEITRKKDGVRAWVLSILAIAVEILEKSYFKTGKAVFLQKIPKFLAAYQAIEQNGHVKLQLVANLS